MTYNSSLLFKAAKAFISDHNKVRDSKTLDDFDKIIDGIADSCSNNREFLLRIGCQLIVKAYEVNA